MHSLGTCGRAKELGPLCGLTFATKHKFLHRCIHLKQEHLAAYVFVFRTQIPGESPKWITNPALRDLSWESSTPRKEQSLTIGNMLRIKLHFRIFYSAL